MARPLSQMYVALTVFFFDSFLQINHLQITMYCTGLYTVVIKPSDARLVVNLLSAI